MSEGSVTSGAFDDLLEANRTFAEGFGGAGDGKARAGLAVVTCMDARIDPLAVLGLEVGDAKVMRNPGGRVTDEVMQAIVLATCLLGADRVVLVEHTRCAMASSTEAQLQDRVGSAVGADAAWRPFGVVADQEQALQEDAAAVRAHPLVPDTVTVGGFLYDVDSGRLRQLL
ncbi:MAG TPA: carbonic anhydrase [Segeticoccus sp.]|nr:carbonic anhydrase [Segeticoccus sp.]